VTLPRTLTWFLMVAVLAGVGLLMSLTGAAQPLQSAAQRIAEPAEAALRSLSAPLTEGLATLTSLRRLRAENRELRLENERLRVALAQAREDDVRAAALTELLRLGSQFGSDKLTVANVIARDPTPMRAVVLIDRGTRDGVQNGMPVLGKGGALVGTVERALEGNAWVRLITDPKSAANAIVQESRWSAVAVGGPDHTVRMEFLEQGAEVKPGDTVLTSGLGGVYPPGLLIGRVAKVEGGPLDVFKRVQVEPAARLSSLESVAVLTGFHPTPIEGLGR